MTLDGNAIGGLMHEVFGAEMTAATGTCAHCGNVASMAEVVVYLGGPGSVARCPACLGLLMVVVRRYDINCVDLLGLADIAPASPGARTRS